MSKTEPIAVTARRQNRQGTDAEVEFTATDKAKGKLRRGDKW